MPKIKKPISFSDAYAIAPSALIKEGVLDPVLNVDTKLFIDPLLLSSSRHVEIRNGAITYQNFFSILIRLLKNASSSTHVAFRTAQKRLSFDEIKGTCLGYGAASTSGRAWGKLITGRVLKSAKEIIDLGVDDPELFLVVALLEDGIGPDLISDMTTNIILPDLAEFNKQICKTLNINTLPFKGPDGSLFHFPRNPLITESDTPVILVPLDILRDLPIVTCWSDIGDAASKNAGLRNRVNSMIGRIWESAARKKNKEAIRKTIYSNKEAFDTILETLRSVPKTPYDAISDPEGHLAWVRIHNDITNNFPLALALRANPTVEDVQMLVHTIVNHYTDLVENKGLWKELWHGTKPRPEKSAQRIFFAIADAYCKANNLDISPEADSGSGPVDFKISSGYKSRVLVEIKLSTNSAVVSGYEKQLEAYKDAESTTYAIYLIINVGNMGNKDKRILDLKNDTIQRGESASEVLFVDGMRKKSASKR